MVTSKTIGEQSAMIAAATSAATTAASAAAAIVANDISYIKNDISEIKDSIKGLSGEYVLRAEFNPIARIVYGLVGILGAATIAAILKLIFK